MTLQCFDPPGMKFAAMSQAVAAGGLLHVSGQLALAGGALVGAGDARRQAEQCFANLEAVLRSAGASLADVVKLTCFLTDRQAYAGYAEVKARLFPGHPPAGTAVIVSELLVAGALMEVEAVAVLR
jgi:reactive intermediate/imine deaminase